MALDLRNMDCMELMKQFPDKHFDLAIVDPPYGIGWDGEINGMVTNNTSGKWKQARGKNYTRKSWDSNKPDKLYFDELFRVSKNQIVWGGNYFELPPSAGVIVWDKMKPDDFSLSQGELAWVSHSNRMAIFQYLWHGFQKAKPENRIHPTQKPVDLYKWTLNKYAKEGWKILDTHLGSGSIAIACHDYNFDLTACEIDKEYFDLTMKRVQNHVSQLSLLH